MSTAEYDPKGDRGSVKWHPNLWEHPDGPPRDGDVWREDEMDVKWTVRLNANGEPEFYQPGGPGFVPAHDVPKFRVPMTLLYRTR